MAFTIRGGKFSTTDDDKTIRQSPVDEVIDILDQGPQALANIRDVYNQVVQRPAPVNVGMMPEQRGGRSIPMGQSTFVSILDRSGNPEPQPPLTVQSPFETSIPNTSGISTLPQEFRNQEAARMQGSGLGLPSVFTNLENLYDPTNTEEMRYVSDPITGAMQGSYMAAPGDLGKMDERFMAAENNPLAQFTNPIVNAIAGMQTNPRTGEKFDMTNPDDRYDFYNLTQDTKKASEEAAEARKLDQDRLARMALAAQQPQTSDPCPEGYRLDPVSQVCVPTDDTTEPGTDTGRVYEPLAVPQANYTPYTGPLNIPSITLPDIFTGK